MRLSLVFLLYCLASPAYAQWNTDFYPDPSFGQNGGITYTFSLNYYQQTNSMNYNHASFIQPDGRIVVAGQTLHDMNYPSTTDLHGWASRFLSNGQLDTTYGTHGDVMFDFPPADYNSQAIYSTLRQSTGKVIVVGTTGDAPTYDIVPVLYRLLPDGTRDMSFGTGGQVLVQNLAMLLFVHRVGFGVFLDSTDRIVTSCRDHMGEHTILRRFTQDGLPDLSFGTNGVQSIPVSTTQYLPIPGGGFLAMGGFYNAPFLKFHSNATQDPTFNGPAPAFQPYINAGQTEYTDLKKEPDGKLLLLAMQYYMPYGGWENHQRTLLMRMNPDGSADPSFGNNGIVLLSDSVLNMPGYSVCSYNDKIYIGGSYGDDLMILKLNSNGSVDSSFGTNGKLLENLGNSSYYNNLILSDNGMLTAVGNSGTCLIWSTVIRRFILPLKETQDVDAQAMVQRALQIFPNPAQQNVIHVAYLAGSTGRSSYVVTDATGKTVLSDSWQVLQSGQQQFPLQIAPLRPGIYALTVQHADGTKSTASFSRQ